MVYQFVETKSYVWKYFGKLYNNAIGNQVDEGYNFCIVCLKHQQSEFRSQLIKNVRLKPRQQIPRLVLLNFAVFLFVQKTNFDNFLTSNRFTFFSVHQKWYKHYEFGKSFRRYSQTVRQGPDNVFRCDKETHRILWMQ